MKRLFLGVAIASALGLTGCGGDSVDELRDKAENKGEILIPESHIAFDPGNADPAKRTLPVPNDLLFSGTSDGTINMSGEMADGTSDYTDPSMAIGALDGWSTTSPISITVELASDHAGKALTLDAASVFQAGAVRVFEATVGGPLSSDPECSAEPSASACKVGDELTFGVDFVSKASGSTIAIVPLKPLKANQSYIYVTTDLIQDSASQSIAASATYTSVRLDIETHPLETPSQLSLQTLINSYEKGLASAHGVDPETISFSGLFTTQSVADVYETSKLLIAGQPGYMPEFVEPPHFLGYNLAQALQLPEAHPAYAGASKADVWQAKIKVPVFGECSSVSCLDEKNQPLINSYWSAMGDSPVSVLLALQAGTLSQTNFGAQAVANGVDPSAALANPALLAGKTWLLDDGTAADKTKHLTKFNPIPQIKNYEVLTVQITVPNFAPAPAAGWPTTIAMHGLGGGKEMAYSYAGTYAGFGVATMAIDMPLHGSRSYDANKDGIYEVSATDPSFGTVVGTPDAFTNGNPLVFINIASTLTVRDNFRQATLDHLGLRASLTGYAGALAKAGAPQLFDINNISAQGLSLGAIVGTNFSTYASTGLTDPTSGADLSYVYKLNAASLVAPSGGFAGSFIGSPTFEPQLFANIIASDSFKALFDAANTAGYEPGTEEYKTLQMAVYQGFLPSFAFAVQTVVDSADPINHAAMLKGTELPLHLIEVVGDGAKSLPDQVLPNTVDNFPISGTEPLIANLGLECVDSTTQGSGAVRFTKGHHSSIISPSAIPDVTDGYEAAATVEMQTQVAFFAHSARLPDATSPTIAVGLSEGSPVGEIIAPCN
ncbi:lipase [Shewanella hanedai]|uniref:Lipase n=1 Tax=Shewanella hanedai TaxID=25 RepID=A0A553JD50_SHEHA|nr:VolA/Pla-1 family phospholipase [Shewanella hanedai]TRY10377.1 lipase [Shewanella hanedai]GGJ05426.1 lipase [Shewanella hanedai]